MVQMFALPWAIPVVFGCLVGIVAILANAMSSTIQSMSDTSLKKRMVDQGFTASDIERVVCAKAGQCPRCGYEYSDKGTVPSKPPKHRSGAA